MRHRAANPNLKLFCSNLTSLPVSAVASGLRNVQGLVFTADRQHLLAAESTARSLSVFQAVPVDGKLLPAATIPLAFLPSTLSLSHSRLLAAGPVQALRTALFGSSKMRVDSVVAAVPLANAEQCAQHGAALAATSLTDVKGVSVTAALFAAANALVVGTESHGVRVCFSN